MRDQYCCWCQRPCRSTEAWNTVNCWQYETTTSVRVVATIINAIYRLCFVLTAVSELRNRIIPFFIVAHHVFVTFLLQQTDKTWILLLWPPTFRSIVTNLQRWAIPEFDLYTLLCRNCRDEQQGKMWLLLFSKLSDVPVACCLYHLSCTRTILFETHRYALLACHVWKCIMPPAKRERPSLIQSGHRLSRVNINGRIRFLLSRFL